MGYSAEHCYNKTRNKAGAEKLAGKGIDHARQNHANVLAILSSVFEFVQEGNRFVNFFNLCPSLLIELCLVKSCFISLIHLSKRI